MYQKTKLHAERQREYRETHKNLSVEYARNYRRYKSEEKFKKKLRKMKHRKHLRQLTLHELQLYTIIIKPMNKSKEMLLVIHLVVSTTCDRLWYMNDSK
jgi:hypothetical protein